MTRPMCPHCGCELRASVHFCNAMEDVALHQLSSGHQIVADRCNCGIEMAEGRAHICRAVFWRHPALGWFLGEGI